MASPLLRWSRSALLSLAAFGFAITSLSGPAFAGALGVDASKQEAWLYKGSDIPPDPAWRFGVLKNGVRYAVRRSGVPPRQVSIRVGIEAGSLMERETERGFAHYLEHLSFRGSRYVVDGEAKRVWQRLGATFGSDTNASTTFTQTIYKLDLPSASREGLDESVKILSGMMAGPTITQAEVDAERRTVLAEAREQSGAQVALNTATTGLFFAGQLVANRSPIGTTESLNAATPQTLRAFHDRWYRPERAIVVIAGDADPAIFEEMIVRHFSDWKGIGSFTPDPDFGKPTPSGPASKVVVEPGTPTALSLATLRPWQQKNDTIAYNQGKLVDLVALRLINRRLEQRARAGGSFLQAQIDQDDLSRSVDGTFVQIVPLGNDWRAALRDVRGVIADALVNAPPQDDINREAGEFFAALQIGVETERTEAAAKQADDILQAVDIRETVATAQVAYDVFAGIKDQITPASILASTKRLFAGVGPRALLASPVAVPRGDAALAEALAAPVIATASKRSTKPVSFEQLPSLGKPGAIVSRKPAGDFDMEQIEFANGVKLLLVSNPAETGKVYVNARFGAGLQALPTNRATLAWAGPAALLSGGAGPLDENAIDRLTSARKIGVGFAVGDNAFSLTGATRASDLADQLRLMATYLAYPRWDPAPVNRARASYLTGYDTLAASPQTVLQRDLGGLLRGGDKRWSTPSRAEIAALSPAAFRAFWTPLLKSGPIELMIFGDVDADAAIRAAAASFGALPRRASAVIAPASAKSRGPSPTKTPIIRTHKGPADQAIAVLAWPLGGGIGDIFESRKLDLLSAIFNDRMFDQLREAEGQSYSPNVNSDWPTGIEGGGNFSVTSQIKPSGVDRFFALSKSIAADLATKPVTADEMTRSVGPLVELIRRASSGNTFYMQRLAGASRDPRRISALKNLIGDYQRITPADLQAAAKKWLVPEKAFSLVVLPETK
ncbi:MAG: M16 family metallopeptidase [Sphingomonadaceae bacterium]